METISIRSRLLELQDPKYREFQCKLMPTVDPATVLGVRMPELRKLARKIQDTPVAQEFLWALPHRYYEENNLHGILLSWSEDGPWVMAELQRFLPHINNWATCDLLRPGIFARDRQAHLPQIRTWLTDDHPYTVRFALEMLMVHYLDEPDIAPYLQMAVAVNREEYYIRMMVAWFFATALTKRYPETLPLLENHSLPRWIHLKAIQKAIESHQIPQGRKAYLKTLR